MANKLNLLKKKDVRTPFPVRLQRAVNEWRRWTKPMRDVRLRLLKQYASGWYDANFSESYLRSVSEKQPLNLIDRGVNILAPYLISHNPRVLVDPKRGLQASASFARTLELAMEHLLDEIEYAKNTLRPVVVNSLFCMGITKTGIMADHQVEVMGYLHDVGQPYCDNVDFEDYIADWRARNRQENAMEGNWYLLPEEYVRTSGLYKNTDGLNAEQSESVRDGAPSKISKDRRGLNCNAMQDVKPMVWMIDLWLPDENIIVTIPPEGQGNKILRTVEWDGPEKGPFDVLAYKYFPDTTIPIPPIYSWIGLNNMINRLVDKMKIQAEREKKLLLYEVGANDDADLIRKAADGGTVGVRNTDGIKEVELGGVSETNFPFIQYLEQQYSIQGGNLYTLGGRETQASTLGQEQMLQANASKHLQDMMLQVHTFARNNLRKLAWYLWSDPLIQIPVVKELGGFKLKVTYTPEVREGDFFDYGFDIEPYSMSMMSPDMRYQRLMQLIGQVVLPTAQMAQMQGANLNVVELVKEAARFLDIRNLDNWYVTGIPQSTAQNPHSPAQGTPSGQSSGQSDGRFQNSESDNLSNLNQHMNRTGGQMSSAEAEGSSPVNRSA